jgi:3-deoxy-D-manno-octulosonate 8-phosphate phosphatase (KDO 8-P phosphatase)
MKGPMHSRAALAPHVARALAAARLVVLDVDGTLTDGSVTVGPGGEALRFAVIDGFGIKELQRAGIAVAWISGRSSPATRARAQDLGVTEVLLGQLHKTAALTELQTRLAIAPEATVVMGDDLPDLSLRSRAAMLAAPANARPEVLERAELVTRSAGGAGAVRELAEVVLMAQGRWRDVVAAYAG